MKYLLTIYADESNAQDVPPEARAAMLAEYGAFTQAATEAGAYIAGEGLESTNTATTVRVQNDERVVTDGPFAETKEQLGGFYMLDCANLDEAIGWAARLPGAKYGSVEVRPVMNYEAAGQPAGAAAGAQGA